MGGAALLDDPMKGTVPLVVAKLRARAHHRNQYAAGFQEAEGMADMIAVAAPVKGRVHDDAVIDGRRGKRKEVRLPHRFKAVQHAQLMGKAGLDRKSKRMNYSH